VSLRHGVHQRGAERAPGAAGIGSAARLGNTARMLELNRETLASPLGKIVLLSDRSGHVRALDWFDCRERMHDLLDRHYGRGGWAVSAAAEPASSALQALRAYFGGALDALDGLHWSTAGSPFQRQVWAALCSIPAGQTQGYGELAERIGQPGKARAIGLAVGANPISLILPCHRVVGSGGQLTGYAGGIERKRWLLEHEGVLLRLPSGASGRATRL
jgi:O-6-methylguanine DNA methyltransferase